MNDLIYRSISVETASQYNNIWRNFQKFCHESLSHTFVVTIETLSLYIAHLDLRNLQPSTIQSHLSATSFFCKLNNMPDYTTSFQVAKLMKSLHKKSTSTDIRLPINSEVLDRLILAINHLCVTQYEQAMY